jgi:hypothetical protein
MDIFFTAFWVRLSFKVDNFSDSGLLNFFVVCCSSFKVVQISQADRETKTEVMS